MGAFSLALVTFNEASAQLSPYSGSPYPIPGTIQAENYDNGAGHYDLSSGNYGDVYRPNDNADIQPCVNTSCSGYAIGWIQAGEWLKYTVQVAASGRYTLEARVATTQSGKTFRVELDGANVSGTLTVPQTSSWDNFVVLRKTGIQLSGGQHILRIFAQTDGFNIDQVRFIAEAASTPTPAPTVSSTSCSGNGSENFYACYYHNRDLTSLAHTRIDSVVNFDWGTGSPHSSINGDTFSASWQGTFTFSQSGDYVFRIAGDDGVRLYINNKLVIDRWVDQAYTEYQLTKYINAGKHLIRMEYYESTGGARARLSWALSGSGPTPPPTTSPTPAPVPSSVFFNETFDSTFSTFNSSSYGNFSNRSEFRIQNQYSASGQYAIQHTLASGDTNLEYITQHFGDSIAGPVHSNRRGEHFMDYYIQYKVMYPTGFNFGTGVKQFIIGTQDERSHSVCCNPWVSHYTTIYVNAGGVLMAEANNKQSSSGQWVGLAPNMNGYSSSNRFIFQTNRWYTMEVRRRLNDAGQDNGIFEMWVDGVQVARYTNVRYRVPYNGTYGSNFNYGTNFAMLSDWMPDPVPRNQAIYYDDIRMATSRIGGGSSTPAPTPATVTLGWNPNPESIAGYRIYYGFSPGQYLQAPGQGLNVGRTSVPNQPVYTVPNLERGRRYYFSVTAYDSSGRESPRSSEVSVVTP